jgi:hypothetical protein
MKMTRKLLALCLLVCSLTAQALTGWNLSLEGDALRYVPSDLPSGKQFEYRVYGPFDLGDANLKSWFSEQALAIQDTLGKPIEPWVVKPDKQKWSIGNSFKARDGQVYSVGYEGGHLEDGRAYIMRMVSSRDLALMMKYALTFYTVLDDAKQQFTNKSATTAQASSKPEIDKAEPTTAQESVRVAPGEGADLSDIEEVWVYSNIDVIWGGIDVDTTLLFEDGSAYLDCTIPPDELDVEVSKRLEPKRWTRWRTSWGDYQIWNPSKETWVDMRGEPGEAIDPGTRLSGDYLNAGGSQYSGSWKRHIIFHDDGTFELSSFSLQSNSMMGGGSLEPGGGTAPLVTTVHSSDKSGSSGAASVIGSNVGGGTSSKRRDGSKNTGVYEINEYSVTLKHDNGYTHTELLYYEKRKGENNLVYGNDLYWLDD